MSPRVLFAARDDRWEDYRRELPAACRDVGVEIELARDHAPETVDYIVCAPNGPVTDFRPFTRAKAVLNLWAGVEDIAPNPTLRLPLVRMVDPDLTQGMVEWVTGHVLRHHLGLDEHILRREPDWRPDPPPLSRDRPVGILGLGALGTAAGRALAGLGFPVTGWRRRGGAEPGLAVESGEAGLERVLAGSAILVLLLPLTAATENLLDARRLAMLPEGAVLLNPGRGALIDDAALLAALDTGRLGHATLDVFREEPLPAAHPFWAHPRVTVTPHVASETRVASAARSLAESIRRGEAGEPFENLVDRDRGY